MVLLNAGSDWSHGYDLARQANVKSGTLYPLLVRLKEQGFLAAEWQQPTAAGRPPRHAYRLTAQGLELARTILCRRAAIQPSPHRPVSA